MRARKGFVSALCFCLGLLAVDLVGQGLPPHIRVNGQYPGFTVTGPILFPSGTALLPSIASSVDPSHGFWFVDANYIGVASGGSSQLEFGLGGMFLKSTGTIGWSSTSDPNAASDIILKRTAVGAVTFFDGSTNFGTMVSGIGLNMASNRVIGWSSGADSTTGVAETYLSRAAAGMISSTGGFQTAAGTTTVPSLLLTNGVLLSAATANTIENDGAAFYSTMDATNGRRFDDSWNYFRLAGSGSGITTIADFFGSNDGIPLVASGRYEIEWVCYFSQATAGTATWTVVTATTALANITGEYIGSPVGGIAVVGTPQTAGINTTASSSTAFPVTGTEADANTHYFKVRVVVTAGAGASNTRLRLTMSAGTATPLINSYFRVRRLPAANTGAFVA